MEEVRELRETAWAKSLGNALIAFKKQAANLVTKPNNQFWKIELATKIRRKSGASISWLETKLHMRKPAIPRGYLHRHHAKNQQSTA
jgi:hypothetical protein